MNSAHLDYSKSTDVNTLRIFARHRENQVKQLRLRLAKAERKAAKNINTDGRLRAIEAMLKSSSSVRAKGESTARLTLQEVARELDVDPRTVRRYISSGKLRSYRLGKGKQAPIRVTRRDMDLFLEAIESEKVEAEKFVRRLQARR